MYLIGIDEAGRGPWAGPVFASVVILNPEDEIKLLELGIKDSKKLTPYKREKLFRVIKELSVFFNVLSSPVAAIDEYGVYKATKSLIQEIVGSIPHELLYGQKIFIDGVFKDFQFPNADSNFTYECVIDGDESIPVISAASILAKVIRDQFMYELDKEYPEYAFAKHKGYGTKLHRDLLLKYGPCKEHRKSFKPIQKLINNHNSL
jgi:ribonuclease HII